MKFHKILLRLPVFAAFIYLSGCGGVSETYHRPDVITDTSYNFTSEPDSSNIAFRSWDNIFTDSTLRSLIREGIANNLDLKIAVERIKESDAFLKQKGADNLPTLDFGIKTSVSKLTDQGIDGNTRTTDPFVNYNIGFSSSWEADLWGKFSSAERSAYAELLKNDALRKAVQTRLISSIAFDYYSILRYNSQIKIAELTVNNRVEDLETMKLLKDAGRVTEAAVKQSEAQVYAAQVLLPQLRRIIHFRENSLNLLLGRMPTKINTGDLDNSPAPDIDTLVGYPSQLLTNRPDVFASEQSLISAFENTNVARANFYPQFSITAALGLESFDAAKLFIFPGSIFANVLGQIVQPIFDKRKNKTQLEISQARLQAEVYLYQSTFLTAVMEVSNALVNYQQSTQTIQLYLQQRDALELALEYSRELLKNGYADYLEVLRAEDFLLRVRLDYSDARLEQLLSGVELYRSLGGGWR